MKTIIQLSFLSAASAFGLDCDLSDLSSCSISGGPLKFNSKYVGTKNIDLPTLFQDMTEVYNFEYDYSINFEGLKNSKWEIPKISVQENGKPIDHGLYKVTSSSQIGSGPKRSFVMTVNDDSVNLNTVYGDEKFNTVLSGGLIESWVNFQLVSVDPTLKVEHKGAGSDRFIAEFAVKEVQTTSVVLVLNAFAKGSGKRTDIESKLSFKWAIDVVRQQFNLGITNNYSFNGKKRTYAGKFFGSVPEAITNEIDIADKFKKPVLIKYNDRHCRGYSKCRVPERKPQFFFKLIKDNGRLQAAFGSKFLNILPPVVVLTTRANPFDSVAPLWNKIKEIDGLTDCDIKGIWNAENIADYIRQNKDKQACIRAVVFPDQMLDVLDREYGLNCNTIFRPDNLDITSKLTYNGFKYPDSVIDVCKYSVAGIKEKYPAIRDEFFKKLGSKNKADLMKQLQNAF